MLLRTKPRAMLHAAILALVALTGGLLVSLMGAGPACAEPRDVRIIYVSNMPEAIAEEGGNGLGHLASLLKSERAAHPNLIFLHGGDSLSPSMLSSLDRGAHMVDLLNVLQPDVMAVAKREFAYGEDVLVLRAQEAAFPFVSANVRDKDTGEAFPFIEPGVIVTAGDVSIGVVVLTAEAVVESYNATRTLVLPPMEVARDISADLRRRGADVVLLLHDGTEADIRALLDEGTVDLVLGTTYYGAPAGTFEKNRVIHHERASGFASISDISVEPGKPEKLVVRQVRQNIDFLALEPDQTMVDLVRGYTSPLNSLLDMKLGVVETPLDTTRPAARGGENAFANLVVDAMLEHTGADLAMVNGGSIRGERTYEAGTVLTRRIVQTELPFRNVVVVLEISGDQLAQAVDYSLNCMTLERGCGLHFSNVVVRYADEGDRQSRAQTILVGGEMLDPKKTYRVATTDYIASGADGFNMFDGAKPYGGVERGQLVWEIVSKYLLARDSVAPAVEGRLSKVGQ